MQAVFSMIATCGDAHPFLVGVSSPVLPEQLPPCPLKLRADEINELNVEFPDAGLQPLEGLVAVARQ